MSDLTETGGAPRERVHGSPGAPGLPPEVTPQPRKAAAAAAHSACRVATGGQCHERGWEELTCSRDKWSASNT